MQNLYRHWRINFRLAQKKKLDLPPEERLEGTAAAVALCIERGVDIVRVHDVAAMRKVARLADAVVRR